ncbi:hypothetical protein BZK31_15095 [Pseudomonas floridensis]|uniref:Dermonecrotic toxin N-terminal domain-containing protein n=1 Tax=Pseudomonas floridensis TaxID=1958950 RepID=A0A1X0N4F6_9PSED|nr:DUF6543 domain-containing protein [Pseudomonas floridensis]ORC58412.1 hypothetical protein BZK31_15095 [Pseudomonas floridensis]
MSSSPPYFFSTSLKTRFAQDIQTALEKAVLSTREGAWLKRLVDNIEQPPDAGPLPRVDRLFMDDGSCACAELAGALMISDPEQADSPLFLSTLMFGIERFEQRTALLAALQQRFDEIRDASSVLSAEHVEGSLFDKRSAWIMRQQAEHLEQLALQLHELPDLRKAVGQAVQGSLRDLNTQAGVDVFSHPVQIVEPPSSAGQTILHVAGTQPLVDVALNHYVVEAIPAGLQRQFMDARGRVLSEAESAQITQALVSATPLVGDAFEQLLSSYWTRIRTDGRTMRDYMTHALAETFRQHLLIGRERGVLNQQQWRGLSRVLPSHAALAGDAAPRVRKLSVAVAGQEPVKVVGQWLIDFPQGDPAGLYLYCPSQGVRRFDDLARLTAHFSGSHGRAELLRSCSLNDHPLIREQGDIELRLEILARDYFAECVDSVIALQKRNLRYVLELPALGFENTPVRIDDALDIRALIDGRLTALHDSWRWRSGSTDFGLFWSAAAPARLPHLSGVTAPVRTWSGKLDKISRLIERMEPLHSGVDGCMRNALNFYLALVGGPHLDARALWVLPGDDDQPPVALLSLALERVCGQRHAALSGSAILQGLRVTLSTPSVDYLPISLLEQMLGNVLDGFAARYARQITDFYERPLRHINTRVRPGALSCLVREYALRLEVFIERRVAKLPAELLDGLQQLLDRPTPAVRRVLNDQQFKAFTLSIRFGTQRSGMVIPDAFFARRAQGGGKAIMWMLAEGFRVFDSTQALTDHLVSQLNGAGGDTSSILQLFAEPDALLIRRHLDNNVAPDIRVEAEEIDGHFIQALQKHAIDRQCRAVSSLFLQACTWGLRPVSFTHLLNRVERDDRSRRMASSLGVAIQLVIYQTIVPVWISEAPLEDQFALADALRRFFVTCVAQEDFLFDIPGLHGYARELLSVRLKTDFPEKELDPDNIIVTLTHYVPIPGAVGQVPQSIPAASTYVSEPLSAFAVNRLMSRQDGALSLTSQDGKPLDAGLTPAYVRGVVDSLDVAAGYRRMLEKVLVKTDPAYARRQKLFAEQIPAVELLRALAFKLKGELSAKAYRFIDAVLNMPDGIARLSVDGCRIGISPLLLLPAAEGWEATTVLNTYLIAPMEKQPGPWILYVLMHDEFVFKEYADQAALLADIRTSSSLQTLMLQRIEPGMRHIYDKGGFMEPHLPFSVESSWDLPLERPQPVTLEFRPFEGNALEYLFRGALQFLKLQIKEQSVSNAEHSRNKAQYLFTLGTEQVMALLPGRLGALVGVWQSQALFNSSLTSASEKSWGKAVSEFLAALGVLISSKQDPQSGLGEGEDIYLEPQEGVEEESGETEDVPSFPDFSWSNGSLTDQVRVRLRAFEVTDVALNTLTKDEMFNTYDDLATGKRYASIDGKAYQVRSGPEGWSIVAGDLMGPPIRLNRDQRWMLDLPGGLKGGGGIVSRAKTRMVDGDVDDVMVVTARGMEQIRSSFQEMACAIEEGHAQARLYLENCMNNLARHAANGEMDGRVKKILGDFFDHRSPDPRLHDAVKHVVTTLYEGLMDPSLSPVDSTRYVVGINRYGEEMVSAFVLPKDPLKRLYLTEHFFRVPSYRLKLGVLRAGQFKFGDHYRSAILLHELSHLVLDTEDIAYVDGHAPFIDMLEDAPRYRLRVKNEQILKQQKALSYQTDRSQLFKNLDEGAWRDLSRTDGAAKGTILRLTGKKSLEQARDVFYSDVQKRTDIMLANADSVALLVTLLGRERFTD